MRTMGQQRRILKKIDLFFKRLCELGPLFGYFPEENKSILVVREKDVEKAEKIMGDNGSNFKIKTGYRYLGSFIGEKERQTDWVEEKISDWIKAVENLSEVAVYVPQSAYAGMQRALQQEWTFMQRVIPGISASFFRLESTIKDCFFLKLFGENIPPEYRDWVSTSIKQGGTAIPKPEEMAELNYKASTCECSHLIDSLKEREVFDGACHTSTMKGMRKMMTVEKAEKLKRHWKVFEVKWIN